MEKKARRKLPRKSQNKTRVDLDPQSTSHSGIKGNYELFLRRYKIIAQLLTLLPLYALGALCLGIAGFPAVLFFKYIFRQSQSMEFFARHFVLAVTFAASFFIYGFTMLLVIPFFNWLLRTKPKPWRGPYYSFETIPWYIHNGLVYLVRYTFLEFITPTPYNLVFFKMMGMKIGHGTQINSSHISDPCLIELGNKVTIGGSATLMAHYGQGGFLVLAPVKIGDGATIGLKASVMGGVEIGAGAKVMPHSVVMPKTVIPAGEIWGGIPAQKISKSAA